MNPQLIWLSKIPNQSEVLILNLEAESLLQFLIFVSLLDARSLILTDSRFKEVGLSLERDHVHPFKWVSDVVLGLNSKREQETVSDELDVLVHQGTVHANQLDWERLGHKVLFDLHRLIDDLGDSLI